MSIFSPDFSLEIKTCVSCNLLSISSRISERHLQMPKLNCFHLAKHKQQRKPTSPPTGPLSVSEISVLAVAHVRNLEVILDFSLLIPPKRNPHTQ